MDAMADFVVSFHSTPPYKYQDGEVPKDEYNWKYEIRGSHKVLVGLEKSNDES